MIQTFSSYMVEALNDYAEYYGMHMDETYRYQAAGKSTPVQLKKSLEASAKGFINAMARDKKQITEEEFVNYFKKNLLKRGYNDQIIRDLYYSINFDKSPESKGLDVHEVSSFILGMDEVDGTHSGDVSQKDIIGTFGLLQNGDKERIKIYYSVMGDKLNSIFTGN